MRVNTAKHRPSQQQQQPKNIRSERNERPGPFDRKDHHQNGFAKRFEPQRHERFDSPDRRDYGMQGSPQRHSEDYYQRRNDRQDRETVPFHRGNRRREEVSMRHSDERFRSESDDRRDYDMSESSSNHSRRNGFDREASSSGGADNYQDRRRISPPRNSSHYEDCVEYFDPDINESLLEDHNGSFVDNHVGIVSTRPTAQSPIANSNSVEDASSPLVLPGIISAEEAVWSPCSMTFEDERPNKTVDELVSTAVHVPSTLKTDRYTLLIGGFKSDLAIDTLRTHIQKTYGNVFSIEGADDEGSFWLILADADSVLNCLHDFEEYEGEAISVQLVAPTS